MSTVRHDLKMLYELTLALVDNLDQVTYEDLVAFTDERYELVKKIQPFKDELHQEEKELIKQINSTDYVIMERIEFFKREASEWLLKQVAIREQRLAYNANFSPDSMFFDHKK